MHRHAFSDNNVNTSFLSPLSTNLRERENLAVLIYFVDFSGSQNFADKYFPPKIFLFAKQEENAAWNIFQMTCSVFVYILMVWDAFTNFCSRENK